METTALSKSMSFHSSPNNSPDGIIKTNPKSLVNTGLGGFAGILFQTDTDHHMGQKHLLKKSDVI